jgi:lipid-binding SYLF domain-containing protein
MSMKQVAALLTQITLSLAIGGAAFAQLPSLAPTAAQINREASAALRDLYSHNEAAKALGAKAKAVLVFPDIKKAPS